MLDCAIEMLKADAYEQRPIKETNMQPKHIAVLAASFALMLPIASYAQDASAPEPSTSGANGGTSQKSADRALAKAVRRALAKTQGFDTSGVFVRARGGAVTLSGSVRNGEQIQQAESVAKSVKGVTSVTNKLALFHGGNG
jgi:hyperosmotically inducible periplasmic protein